MGRAAQDAMVDLEVAPEKELLFLAWETFRPQIPHRAIMDLQILVILAAAEAVPLRHLWAETAESEKNPLLLAPYHHMQLAALAETILHMVFLQQSLVPVAEVVAQPKKKLAIQHKE